MHPVLARSLDDLINERGENHENKPTDGRRHFRSKENRHYSSSYNRRSRDLSPRESNKFSEFRRTVTYENRPSKSSHYPDSRSSGRFADHRTGGSITISNLHFEVSEKDLRELFESIGPVSKATIDYDRAGRSNGTATVFFKRHEDAYSARERFQNVPLDGKPMQIELQRWAKTIPRHGDTGGEVSLRNHRYGQSSNENEFRMDLDNELDRYMMSDKNQKNK